MMLDILMNIIVVLSFLSLIVGMIVLLVIFCFLIRDGLLDIIKK